MDAFKKLSLPTNNDISSVADVIEEAKKQSKHKVSKKHCYYPVWVERSLIATVQNQAYIGIKHLPPILF